MERHLSQWTGCPSRQTSLSQSFKLPALSESCLQGHRRCSSKFQVRTALRGLKRMSPLDADVTVCPVCPQGGRELLAAATLSPRLSPGPGMWQGLSKAGRHTSGRERWFCRLAVAMATRGQRGSLTLCAKSASYSQNRWPCS